MKSSENQFQWPEKEGGLQAVAGGGAESSNDSFSICSFPRSELGEVKNEDVP